MDDAKEKALDAWLRARLYYEQNADHASVGDKKWEPIRGAGKALLPHIQEPKAEPRQILVRKDGLVVAVLVPRPLDAPSQVHALWQTAYSLPGGPWQWASDTLDGWRKRIACVGATAEELP